MGNNMSMMKASLFVMIYGVALLAAVLGASFVGALPFAVESNTTLAGLLTIFLVVLILEVFKEEKIRGLRQLTKKPFALVETLMMGLTAITIYALMTMPTIPEAMKPWIGIVCFAMAGFIIIETKE